MSLLAAQQRGIRNHVNLDAQIRSRISDATNELYSGPDCDTAEDYPGFERACREIRNALPSADLWVNTDGDVSESEPHWYSDDDDDEPQECPDDWTLVDALLVKQILVGRELVLYV